eukprot:GFYU01005275.1.p1 GENE.GFYU01005275.1~~GFYU01005275.1.p1  ORF type:complete len:299 (+),score=56.21 GFYU01005275.1:122-1018(+)
MSLIGGASSSRRRVGVAWTTLVAVFALLSFLNVCNAISLHKSNEGMSGTPSTSTDATKLEGNKKDQNTTPNSKNNESSKKKPDEFTTFMRKVKSFVDLKTNDGNGLCHSLTTGLEEYNVMTPRKVTPQDVDLLKQLAKCHAMLIQDFSNKGMRGTADFQTSGALITQFSKQFHSSITHLVPLRSSTLHELVQRMRLTLEQYMTDGLCTDPQLGDLETVEVNHAGATVTPEEETILKKMTKCNEVMLGELKKSTPVGHPRTDVIQELLSEAEKGYHISFSNRFLPEETEEVKNMESSTP